MKKKKNYNFAKFISSSTLDYPDLNRYGEIDFLPVPDYMLLEEGYKRIVRHDHPDQPTNVIWKEFYTEEEDAIVVGWEFEPLPQPDDAILDLEEQVVDHEYRLILLELGV